jgi:uncharacterized protein (UPF0147 family)
LEQKPAPKQDDPASGYDPAELANLKNALKAVGLDPDTVMQGMSLVQQNVEEQRIEVAASFFNEHTDVPRDDIIRALIEDGINLDTVTPSRLKKELAKAHKLIKADSFDPEARAKELALQMLEEMKKGGGEIVEVKKSRGNSGGHKTLNDVLEDPNTDFFAKMDLAAKVKLD